MYEGTTPRDEINKEGGGGKRKRGMRREGGGR